MGLGSGIADRLNTSIVDSPLAAQPPNLQVGMQMAEDLIESSSSSSEEEESDNDDDDDDLIVLPRR